MILKFELRSLCTHRKNVLREIPLFKISDGSGVNRLRLRRNVLRDQPFALGKNFSQWTNVSLWAGFFEGAPFHRIRPRASDLWGGGADVRSPRSAVGFSHSRQLHPRQSPREAGLAHLL